MSSAQFAIVCHGGPIETQAVLCLQSLFQHQRQIHSVKAFYPRELPPISPETKAFLQYYGVEMIEFSNEFLRGTSDPFSPGNKRFLVANKIWCARNLEPDIPRVIMDCDILILSDLTEVFAGMTADIAASPTFIETLGPRYEDLFDFIGIPVPLERIQTVLTRKPICPYFNGGFVMLRNTNNLFETWLRVYRQLKDRSDLIENLYHTDQISLALSILKGGYSFQLWWPSVNVPLGFLDYSKKMKVVHWFNPEVLRQQHSFNPAFRERIAPVVYALRDQHGIDLTKAILRRPASFWGRTVHLARERTRKLKWGMNALRRKLMPGI